jgi:hypothetical protein
LPSLGSRVVREDSALAVNLGHPRVLNYAVKQTALDR